tara:strand:- start:3006 stop:7082 length:4077 start_codon:yes stop_codon:yes gene_type:complete
MPESWKTSSTRKPIINASKIFTNKLVSKSGTVHNDICNNFDISLSENIVIDNVKSLITDTSMNINTLRCNVIDMRASQDDSSYINFHKIIKTRKSASICKLYTEDLSSNNLQTPDLSVNFIESTNTKIIFNSDTSFTQFVYANNIDVSNIYTESSFINIHTDLSINGNLNTERLTTNKIKSVNDRIIIDSDISVNKTIYTQDIDVSGNLKAEKLIVNDISSSNKITINSDLSFNKELFISDLHLEKMYLLDSDKIIINNDVSINNSLTIGNDVSFGGIISPLNEDTLSLNGTVAFNKSVTANTIKADKISLHSNTSDSSAIIFDADVSINGSIYAKMPYLYGAAEVQSFTEILNDSNKKIGALYLLIPQKLETGNIYTTSSLEEFKTGQDISYVRPIQPKVTLYVRETETQLIKVETLNKDVCWNSVTLRNKIHYINNDICYNSYYDNSNEIWEDVDVDDVNDLSHTFDISVSTLTGIKNGVRNDDSFNRIYYFDLSASDPEGFDVSYLLGSKHDPGDTNVIDFSSLELEKIHTTDSSLTRVKATVPYVNFNNGTSEDLSFNIAAHDDVNYVIKTIYLNVDGTVKPREPSWNEVRFETYDICSHKTGYIDQSWNDYSLNNPISTADTRDVSTFEFDISLNAFFGTNKHNLNYIIDLSAIYPETDLDLSFNISAINVGSDTDIITSGNPISLSGNRIILNYNLEDICDNIANSNYNETAAITNTHFNDISINIIAHNYYQFGSNLDASFDFGAAAQDGYGDITLSTDYGNVSYSTDISRNIFIKVIDIIHNKPPKWSKIENISISSEGLGFDASFYKDYSFNDEFSDISAIRPVTHVSSSYIYYIWDTSTVYDISRLQYRIDLSALDPEGFKVDFSYLQGYDNSYNVRISSDKLSITTPGARDPSTNDLSLVIWPQDGGTLPDGSYSDISKNLLFHPFLYKFTEFTFTNCDASGREGPTFGQCIKWYDDRYSGGILSPDYEVNIDNKSIDTWWRENNYFNMDNSGIQLWTVPATGLYNITIAGAGGGRANTNNGHGYGAVIDLSYRLVKGDKYMLLIGQNGRLGRTTVLNSAEPASTTFVGTNELRPTSSSGGGGTFFVKGDNIGYLKTEFDDGGGGIVDLSNYIVAVAGGGSGGKTFQDNTTDILEISKIADGSLNLSFSGVDGSGNITDTRTTGGRDGQGGLGSDNTSNSSLPGGGGGGGGGFLTPGGTSGYNTSHWASNNPLFGDDVKEAEPFISGGKGGFIPHIKDENDDENFGGLGSANVGGFGGGAAGGEGGSGGGGGYSGGGSDSITKSLNDPPRQVDNTIAGGGGSIVNSKVIAYNPGIRSQVTKNDDTNINNFNGYIKIQFNPYNKININ